MQSIQLESLLQNTELITEELSRIKSDIEKQVTHSNYPQTSAITYIERAIRLRQAFRSIADGIEAKRSLAQLQKEKIEKSKNFIQGLQYYKTTLISKIKQSEIDVVDLQEFYDAPLEVNDWIEEYGKIETHLETQLKQKEEQKEELQRLIQKKIDHEHEVKAKKELYQKILPQKAKKIYSEVLETAKLCQIKEIESFSSIESSGLSVVYEKLNPLRINSTIEVSFSKDSYEELQVTILKNDYKLYKLANLNKIALGEREIKFTIACLQPHYSHLVIGLDRRQDYTNDEVFQRLINNELIKPIFLHPKNQNQRNINAKYVRINWLQDGLMTGLISPLEFINAIKDRVFSLMLVGYLSENIKKIGFFFPLLTEQEGQNPASAHLGKKNMTGSLQKITFQQYIDQVHVPSWVQKYRLKYEQLQKEKQSLSFEQQRGFVIDKSNFLRVLNIFKQEELEEPSLNSYYKGSVNIHQSRVEFVLIIPIVYPHKSSNIVITNWQKRKEEEKKLSGLENIPCLARIAPARKHISRKVLMIERAVNSEISRFVRTPENQPFQMLLQINRMISLLGLSAQKRA